MYTFFLWSYWEILPVSMDWLGYWKTSVNAISNKLSIKTMTSVLKVSTYIITACSIRLAAIISVLTLTTVVPLYLVRWLFNFLCFVIYFKNGHVVPSRSCTGDIFLKYIFKFYKYFNFHFKKHTFWLLCFCVLFGVLNLQNPPIRMLYFYWI